MERNDFFAHLDAKPQYSAAYRDKLKDLFDYFLSHGYVLREHALNRVLGQKTGPGKRLFTKEDVVDIMRLSPNYTQNGIKWVRFYEGIAIIQGMDNGEVISIITCNTLMPEWREYYE